MFEIGFEEKSFKGEPIETCGKLRTVTLDNGTNVELLPILFSTFTRRGTSPLDVRRRRHNYKVPNALAKEYALYYEKTLGENWTEKYATNMISSLTGRLFIAAWARDENGNEFPIGFSAGNTQPYNDGTKLCNTEVFVLPTYQKFGVGTELVYAMLYEAKRCGVTNFEGLTYDMDNKNHPIGWWESIGAKRVDLIPIEGNIDEMIKIMEEKKLKKVN